METAIITITVAEFRADMPYFADEVKYADSRIQNALNEAVCYISNKNGCGPLRGGCRKLAIELMAAHLLVLDDYLNSGQIQPQMTSSTSASIDKISVSKGFTLPPFTNEWNYWLALSSFGQRLAALLKRKSATGFLVAGSNQYRLYHP